MKNFISALMLGTGLAAFATAALADEYGEQKDERRGFYLGLEGGAADIDIDFSGSAAPPDFSGTEGLAGIVLGYNFLIGEDRDILLGVELAADGLFENVLDNDDGIGDLVGRVGFLTSPNLMVFARAGFSEFSSDGGDLEGWTLGGGLEYMLTRNLGLRADYRYSEYDENLGIITPDGFNVVGTDITTHRVTAGLSWNF